MLLFPLHRDRLRQVEGLTPDFVTSKLQGRDFNPGLNDLESWVCLTWSQLPLRVQKPWASPNTIIPPSCLCNPACPSPGSSQSGPLTSPSCCQAGFFSPDGPLDSHSCGSVHAVLCSGEPVPSLQHLLLHDFAMPLPNNAFESCLSMETLILFGLVLPPKNSLS